MKTCPTCHHTYSGYVESCPRDGVRLIMFRDKRECPYCAEKILKKARVCKDCGRDVEPLAGTGIAAQAPPPALPQRIIETQSPQPEASKPEAAASHQHNPMKCPVCKLINPDTAQRCDCGYDFATTKIEKPYFNGKLPDEDTTSGNANRGIRRLTVFLYLGLLFGGVLISVWAIPEVFSLPPEATRILTKISLWFAVVVAVLSATFAHRLVKLKSTVITTALLSVGLFLWVLSVHNSGK
jgi:hypothetical protein